MPRAAAEAKDRFMAILSHELRTPLTPVLAAVSALLQRSNVSRSDRPILEMIRRNIELEARLIEDLLDVTRITRNKLQLRVEPVDMHQAIRDVLEMCAEEAHAKSLKISNELRARKTYVHGDPARLRQIIWNLLKNAIKFTPARGLVVIRTSNPSPNRLSLQVTDTGIGIQPALLEKLFSAFEQDEIDRRRYGGLGLGLTISKALVEAHEGTISASSEGKGRGATFVVEMPAVQIEEARSPQLPAGKLPVRPQKLRILLVEDHNDTAQILGRLLESEGHQVRIATNVGDALKLSNEGPMDLIISDLGLPDGSGYDLMHQVRPQMSAPVPAIALSGYGAEADIKAQPRKRVCGAHHQAGGFWAAIAGYRSGYQRVNSQYDAIVVGCGAMGSAACMHLAQRGAKVLGLEQFDIPHALGSSHGYSRMIRLAYYEHPDYVPLLRRAYQLWDELEKSSGQKLLYVTGGIYMGPPEGEVVGGALKAARMHGLAHELMDRRAIGERFPQFSLPENFAGVWEPQAGFCCRRK